MPSDEIKSQYRPTIGIETHVQLKTTTKLFSAVSNDARSAAPNTLITHIDTGLPGALPVLNEAAIELAIRAAFALKAEPQKFSKFDRKHYFYPDLPKGYQITQFENPIIVGGSVEILIDGQPKTIKITRVHLEEDAGKNIHPAGADYSLVDLNRAGTPLLEIVSEPEINSPAEAKTYARELYLLMKYAEVSDVDLYHGNMRFDVNISVSKDPAKLGKRTEIKNLNSFRSVENAVAYEINRQIELYEKGQAVIQETRGWDEAKQKTTSQRGKEESHDYRYMPEPDIPPLELEQAFIDKVKTQLPELPFAIRQRLSRLSMEPKVIEDILDNYVVGQRLVELINDGQKPESIRRLAYDYLQIPKSLEVRVEDHLKVADSFLADQLSSTAAASIIEALTEESTQNVDELIRNNTQVSNEAELDKIVVEVLAENQKVAEDIKNGEVKAIGFLVGQVMAKSQGKANPQLAQQLIKKQLGL